MAEDVISDAKRHSKFLKSSISYGGAILWNVVSTHFTGQFPDFNRKVKKDSYFKELDFSAQSAQSLPRGTTKISNGSKYFTFYALIAVVNYFVFCE